MPQRKPRHVKAKYRSGLETQTAAFLSECQQEVRYEKLRIEWEDLAYRTYTADFVLDNGIIIETKGMFTATDRRKHVEIKRQHPELDIRFVFTNANAKLYKGAKTTYKDWCEKHSFLWANRVIPKEWLDEPAKPVLVGKLQLKQKRSTDV